MGSQTVHKIPAVEFSKENLKPGTSSWISACNDIVRALEEYGCFVAVYDKVSLDLHNTIFGGVEELFDLPTEIKMQNTCDTPYHGYIGQIPGIPVHEGLGIDNATTLEATKSFTNQIWPEGNDRFCENVHLYSKLVAELNEVVIRMVFENYGVEKCYESCIRWRTYLLRLLKYRGPKTNESNVGFTPHTDKSFTSILHQNQVNGLEIKTKDGEWIRFEPSTSSFLFMAGDAFMAWSNGRIHSANHRVVMSGSKPRYSLGLFTFSSGMIQTPEELVDDEHPLQFKPFDHLDFIRFFYRNEGQKAKSALKSYCGV